LEHAHIYLTYIERNEKREDEEHFITLPQNYNYRNISTLENYRSLLQKKQNRGKKVEKVMM